MIDLTKKKVQGQIQSFKTPNVVDAISDQGQLQPANVSMFEMSFTTFKDLNVQVQTYIETNIDVITSK
jgi:hypothetical protein